MVMSKARSLALHLFRDFPIDGIILGTGCTRIHSMERVTSAYVLVWLRSDRSDSFSQQVRLSTGVNMRLLINDGALSLEKCAFACLYSYRGQTEEEEVHVLQSKAPSTAPGLPPRPPDHFRMDQDDESMPGDIDADNPTTPRGDTDVDRRRTDTETDRSRSTAPAKQKAEATVSVNAS